MKTKFWRIFAGCCVVLGLGLMVLYSSTQRTTDGFSNLGHGLVQQMLASRFVP